MLISNDWFQRMLMEANADGSAGGGGDAGAAGADKGAAAAKPGDKGAAGAGDKDKYFTQDDVNRMLAEHKRGLKKELETLGGQLTERDQKLQELMESHEEVVNVLKELSASADDKGKKPLINMDGNRDLKDIIKDVTSKLTEYEEEKATWEERFGEIEGKLETEAALREIAEEEALIAERDSLVQRCLIKTGCNDIKTAMKLFEDNIEVDEESGQWFVVNDETGEEWPLAEGVEKMLPDYMKKPLTERTGAGSTGTKGAMGDIQKAQSRIGEIDDQLAALKAEYQKQPDRTKLIEVQKLTREKNALARQVRSARV